MAALFLAIPQAELSVGRLDTAAAMMTDRGTLEYASGEALGERLGPWLSICVGPGGRQAWLDVDIEKLRA